MYKKTPNSASKEKCPYCGAQKVGIQGIKKRQCWGCHREWEV